MGPAHDHSGAACRHVQPAGLCSGRLMPASDALDRLLKQAVLGWYRVRGLGFLECECTFECSLQAYICHTSMGCGSKQSYFSFRAGGLGPRSRPLPLLGTQQIPTTSILLAAWLSRMGMYLRQLTAWGCRISPWSSCGSCCPRRRAPSQAGRLKAAAIRTAGSLNLGRSPSHCILNTVARSQCTLA